MSDCCSSDHRYDPQERTGPDKVAVGNRRIAYDDILQDRETPLDDDAPKLQQRGGRQLVGRRGLALADALQRLRRRLEAPTQAVLFRACLALRLKLFLSLPGDRKSTRLNSSHYYAYRLPSSA